jgi:hypothetical protein
VSVNKFAKGIPRYIAHWKPYAHEPCLLWRQIFLFLHANTDILTAAVHAFTLLALTNHPSKTQGRNRASTETP